MSENINKRLKIERTSRNISQKAVADVTNVSEKTVGRWEKESPIPSDKLAMLSSLGMDVAYILTGVKSTNNEIALMQRMMDNNVPSEVREEYKDDLIQRAETLMQRKPQLDMLQVILGELDDTYFQKGYESMQSLYVQFKSGLPADYSDNSRRVYTENASKGGHNVKHNQGVVSGDSSSFGNLTFGK